MSHPELGPVFSAVGRLRRRVRAQRAVRATLGSAAAVLGVWAVAVLLHAFWLLSPGLWAALLIGGGVAVGLTLLVAAVWPVDPLRTATRLDDASGLKDRLGTALSLIESGGAKNEFEEAQLRDAVRHATAANTAQAAPWRFPREALYVLGFIAAAWGITLLRMPPPEQASVAMRPFFLGDGPGPIATLLPAQLPADPEHEPVIPPEAQEAIKQQLEELKEKVADEVKDLAAAGDSEANEVLAELQTLIDDVARERVDDRSATQRMAELDEKIEEMNEQTPEERALQDAQDGALEEAGKALEEAVEEQKLTDQEAKEQLQELAKQLEEKKFEEASETLQKLMEKFMKLPKEDQERLAKMFKDLAKKFESPLQKELDKLRKDRDRLAKKNEEGGGGSKKDKDRLNKMDRQLEQLSRKQDGSPEERKKRELDKLSRDLKDLADQLRRQKEQEKQQAQGNKDQPEPEDQQARPKPQDGQSLAEMKKMLEEMRKQLQRQRLGQKTKMKMAEMKELMRKDKGLGEGNRRELERLARGGKDKGDRPGGQGGQPKPGRPNPNAAWERSAQKMEQEWKELKPSGGAGAAKAAMLGGPETELEAKAEDDFLPGQKAEGESHRLVLKGAAAKGTAVKGYGELQIDYSMRAARQMQDEEIPPGYREYVEEYFRLIRQR